MFIYIELSLIIKICVCRKKVIIVGLRLLILERLVCKFGFWLVDGILYFRRSLIIFRKDRSMRKLCLYCLCKYYGFRVNICFFFGVLIFGTC